MPTVREKKRGDPRCYEVIFKAVHLGLPKSGLSFYFYTDDDGTAEEKATAYAEQGDAYLKAGIVPDGWLGTDTGAMGQKKRAVDVWTLAVAIREYSAAVSISKDDTSKLGLIRAQFGATKLTDIDYPWAEDFVTYLKRERNVVPGTIRKWVGAIRRCLKWCRNHGRIVNNPFEDLPHNYATYTEEDGRYVEIKEDDTRDRRLEEGEEEKLIAVMTGGSRTPGARVAQPLRLTDEERAAWLALFGHSLETAMRMRESFTLQIPQVDFKQKTIFLEKSKNGTKRRVGMSRREIEIMKAFIGDRTEGRVFPFWTGDKELLDKTTSDLSRQFGRFADHAQCDDLRFHDLRHEGISRLYERTTLSDAEIQVMVGHMSKAAHQRYINLRGAAYADRLG